MNRILTTVFAIILLFPAYLVASEVKDKNASTPTKDFAAKSHLPSGKHVSVVTGSKVNTVTREYLRDQEDIAVTVPGGRIKVHRYYENKKWSFNHNRDNLTFEYDGSGKITEVDKAGVKYEAAYSDAKLFVYDTQRILKTDTGYKWVNPKNNWILYDEKGRLTSYGKRGRTIAKAVFENDKVVGWTDTVGTRLFTFEYVGDNISAVTDKANRRVEYSYEGGFLKTVKNLRGFVSTFSYSNKLLIRVEKPGGKIRNIKYGPYGDVVSVTDDNGVGHFFEFDYDKGTREYYAYTKFPSGKVKEVWYDKDGDTKRIDINGTTVQSIKKDGRTQWVTDARNLVTEQHLDEWENIIKTIYPDGSIEEKVYKQPGNLLTQINRNGILTNYEYNTDGDRVAMVEAVGTADERKTEYSYTSEGSIKTTTIKGLEDTTTIYNYDPTGHLISIVDPENRVTKFTDFDHAGNAKTIEDGRGNKKYLEYDEEGNVRFIRDHNNKLIAEYRYDEGGSRSSQLNGLNKEYLFAYDSNKNLLTVTDPLGSESKREYNLANKPIKAIDQEGNPVFYEYDLFERLSKTIDGEGNSISYEYSTADGCTTCSGGSDLVTRIIYPTFERTMNYDERGRVTEQKDTFDSKEQLTRFEYDEYGNRVSVIDAEGRTTLYDYDALGRVTKETSADDAVTIYLYDKRDNLVQLTDANNGMTLFDYDKSNKLISETRPMLQAISYAYDKAGNLASQTDSNDRKTVYSYDENNRLTKVEIFAKSADSAPSKITNYGYNDVGSLTSYDDSITSASYTYDDLQRKITETINYPDFSLTHGYDYYKNSRKKSYTDPLLKVRSYTYDKAGRPLGITLPNNTQVSMSGYNWNRPTTVNLPGGSSLNYTYNGLQQLLSVRGLDPGSNPVIDYKYSYSAVGNIKTKTTEHGQYGYDYNKVYRLTNATNPNADTESFDYDGLGNRTESNLIPSWEYNANNQLIKYGDTSYGYDDQGNMVNRTKSATTTNFIYNLENRLEKVQDSANTDFATYGYDPYGRRLWKEVGGTKTYFHYTDEGLAGEYDFTGTKLKTYGYHPGSPWSTNPLFVEIDSIYYYYLNDHLGTPQQIIAENGAIVWAARYTSFGEADILTNTIENNLRFPGQYFDSETGLHYNWHRFYDPSTGRYITADPIGLEGGMNLYSYVLGNPINLMDPFGLKVNFNNIDKTCLFACLADATLNFGLGFVPGFKFGVAILENMGVDYNPIQAAMGLDAPFGTTIPGTVAGGGSAGHLYGTLSYEAAGGDDAHKDATQRANRRSATAKQKSKYGKKLKALNKLRKMAGMLGGISNILNGVDYLWDMKLCFEKCDRCVDE